MNWRCLILLLALPSAKAGEVEDAIARGRAARADGVPEAAIYDLKNAAGNAAGPASPQVVVELMRCLIAAGREDEAVQWARRTVFRTDPAVIFWRAQALAQHGDYRAALADYRRAAGADASLRVEADLGNARMLEALGRTEDALAVYAKVPAESAWSVEARLASAAILIDETRFDEAKRLLEGAEFPDRAAKDRQRYLLARIALESGEVDDADRLYEGFKPRDPRLAAGLTIGEADALLRRSHEDKAEDRIETFVRENPGNPLIGDLLAKLDEVRSRERDPSSSTLKQWENDNDNPILSTTATFYLARGDERQGRLDRAIRNYREFIRQNPGHPLRVVATVRLARLLVAGGQINDAAAVLAAAEAPTDRADDARLRFLRGATEFQNRDFAAATKTFVDAANREPAIAESALANAALAAIDAGNDPLAAEILNALRKESLGMARRIELAQAFQNARAERPDAGEQLAWLASQGGMIGERARLASAEWRWEQGDRSGAQAEFRRINNSKAAGVGDQKDYFAVYLADDGSARCVDAVVQAAQDFLTRHPGASREADVRMKLGEVLMRAGDYRGARVQFEEASKHTNDSARRQSALFLAARAAAGSMSPEEIDAAIYTLLEAVASDKSSDLATQARWEQAMLQSARGRFEESVKLLDSLIAATKDPRLQFAARLKKGDALLEWSRTQPARAAEAIKEWRAVAASPDALPAERNEALTHAANASEQIGDGDGAISAYYEVLTAPRDRQAEYFWYYKAGFAAAQLLLKQGRTKEAVAIYEKMAAVPGPQAAEAKEKVKRLRLENFIWED
ncbi:MAG TPA: tetratricopeptide repeat protein [Chthoniobacterales bacterium]